MKTYQNLNSSAINSITIEDNVVKVVYNSSIDKEYTFECQNVDQFIDKLSEELIDILTVKCIFFVYITIIHYFNYTILYSNTINSTTIKILIGFHVFLWLVVDV